MTAGICFQNCWFLTAEKCWFYSTVYNCANYSDIKRESARIIEKYDKKFFISNSYALYLPKEMILNQKFENSYYCVILNLIKDSSTEFKRIEFPAGEYVTCRYAGSSFDRNETLTKLLSFISDKHYEICADVLQLCIIDENLTYIDSEKINEIQIPIKRL